MIELVGPHADKFALEQPPAGQTPDERVRWVAGERPAHGRTPLEWVEWVRADLSLDAPAAIAVLDEDIVESVAALYAAVGQPMNRAAVAEQTADLPEALRGPFADLLDTVATAYVEQLVLAPLVQARLADGFEVHETLVTKAEREAMMARQTRLVAAVNEFRARTADHFSVAAASTPIFSDPEGLVVIGSTGNDTYTRSGAIKDPILLIDPSGDDTYRNSAGGACPISPVSWLECNSLALSVVADLGDPTDSTPNDTYTYTGVPAAVQGAGGPGGLGLLLDVGGNDTYYAKMTRGLSSSFFAYFDGGGQGYGYAGAGALIDGLGNDKYQFDVATSSGRSIWALAQGFGGAGGIGIAHDLTGNDAWLSNGLGGPLFGNAFQGIYTGGGGFYGGVGIAADTGLGDDVWHSGVTAASPDYYAQGFGAFGGVGILYEDGGNDSYIGYEKATSFNPAINPVLNCAFGTASFGGVGVMLELGGNDTYRGETVSPVGAYTMDFGFGGPGIAYGVFADFGGTDSYTMIAAGSPSVIDGYGFYRPGLNGNIFGFPLGHTTFGAFADLGGTDRYVGGRATNNDQWAFGLDRGV